MFRRRAKAVVLVAGLALSACPAAVDEIVPPEVARDAGTADVRPPDAGPAPDAGSVDDIRNRLLRVPGLHVQEIDERIPGTRAFVLGFQQPEDHDDLDGAHFEQRLVLIHRNVGAPMVLATNGYGLSESLEWFAGRLAEPTAAFEGNQLTVEHRYFGDSFTVLANWEHLTVEQSANDSHRIVEALSDIYVGPWIGTGISKGGMTALLHHRFFPDDLDAVVAYVAPLSFGVEDQRYLDHVAQIGPADGVCRTRVKDMAVEVFERRAELARYFIDSDPVAASVAPEVVEAVVTLPAFGYHWYFWQYLGSPVYCDSLPVRGAAIEELAGRFWFRSDRALLGPGFDPYESPYYYQVARELGSASVDNGHLAALASEVDYDVLPPPQPEPPPWGDVPMFDATAMAAYDAFLRNDARHVLVVYGAWDPWSGGAVTVDEANDSHVVVVPEIGHVARISLLPKKQQDEALNRIARWIGRQGVAAQDWTAARARLAAHSADHEELVHRLAEIDRR